MPVFLPGMKRSLHNILPVITRIQSVDLKVKDLTKALHFYSELLGMKPKEISASEVDLFSDTNKPYLVKLTEDRTAKYPARDNTGLFHIAIRFQNRKELARVFMRLFNNKYKFQGFSDHLVSEAIYINDPDENGIELYVDKPKDERTYNNDEIVMDTLPLNLSHITKELDDPDLWEGIHPSTNIGHIHLKVSNIFHAEKFYSFMLGFKVTTKSYPGALFLAAGDYHHHIGANIWETRNGSSPPENSLGLTGFKINIPDTEHLSGIVNHIKDYGLLIDGSNPNSVLVKDFDNIKIRLTL